MATTKEFHATLSFLKEVFGVAISFYSKVRVALFFFAYLHYIKVPIIINIILS